MKWIAYYIHHWWWSWHVPNMPYGDPQDQENWLIAWERYLKQEPQPPPKNKSQ